MEEVEEMKEVNYLFLGLNEMGPNWQGMKSHGIADLLIKCTEQGKKVYLAVLSGTEMVEGGPVSIVNSLPLV